MLDSKEIQPVHPKGNQSWIFTGRTDAEAEAPILWPPDGENWPIGKDPDAGKDWSGEEKRTIEDEMAGWHHRLDGHEFEWTPGVGDGQGGLVCCDSWGRKESDTTERLYWTELYFKSRSLILVLNLMEDIEQLRLSDHLLVKCISLHLTVISCLGNWNIMVKHSP